MLGAVLSQRCKTCIPPLCIHDRRCRTLNYCDSVLVTKKACNATVPFLALLARLYTYKSIYNEIGYVLRIHMLTKQENPHAPNTVLERM